MHHFVIEAYFNGKTPVQRILSVKILTFFVHDKTY